MTLEEEAAELFGAIRDYDRIIDSIKQMNRIEICHQPGAPRIGYRFEIGKEYPEIDKACKEFKAKLIAIHEAWKIEAKNRLDQLLYD